MVEVVPELHRVGCASITARRGGLVASMALHLGVSITRHPEGLFAHIELKASFMGDLDVGRGTPSMVACLFCPWNRCLEPNHSHNKQRLSNRHTWR
jgi:hypothetical protein